MANIEYGVEILLNLGNFQNIKIQYKLSDELREGEHPNEARTRLKGLIDQWTEEEIDRVKNELNA